MSAELVQRLRTPFADAGIIHEAADAIEALTARVEALEAGLRPFADVADHGKRGGTFVIAKAIYDDMGGTTGVGAPRQSHWHWPDFERARALLSAATSPLPLAAPSQTSTLTTPRSEGVVASDNQGDVA